MKLLWSLFLIALLGCSKDILVKKASLNSLSKSQQSNFRNWDAKLIKSCDINEVLYDSGGVDLGIDLSLLKMENGIDSLISLNSGIMHLESNFYSDFKLESFHNDFKNGTDLSFKAVWNNKTCSVYVKDKLVKEINLAKSAIANLILFETEEDLINSDKIRGTKKRNYQFDNQRFFHEIILKVFSNDFSESMVSEFLNKYSISYQDFVKLFTLSKPKENKVIAFKVGEFGIWNSLHSSDVINFSKDIDDIFKNKPQIITLLIKLSESKNLLLKYALNVELFRRNQYSVYLSNIETRLVKNKLADFSKCLHQRIKSYFLFHDDSLPDLTSISQPCHVFNEEFNLEDVKLSQGFMEIINSQDRLMDYSSQWDELIKDFTEIQLAGGKSIEEVFRGYTSKRLNSLSKMLVILNKTNTNNKIMRGLVLDWFNSNFTYDLDKKITESDLHDVVSFYQRNSLLFSKDEISRFFKRYQNDPEKIFKVIKSSQGISNVYFLAFSRIADFLREEFLVDSTQLLGSLFDQNLRQRKLESLVGVIDKLKSHRKKVRENKKLFDAFFVYAMNSRDVEFVLKTLESLIISFRDLPESWMKIFDYANQSNPEDHRHRFEHAHKMKLSDVKLARKIKDLAKQKNNLKQVLKFFENLFFDLSPYEELSRQVNAYYLAGQFIKNERNKLEVITYVENYGINLFANRIIHERWSQTEIKAMNVLKNFSYFKIECKNKSQTISSKLICLSDKNIHRESGLLTSQYMRFLKEVLKYSDKMTIDFKETFVRSFFTEDLPWSKCSKKELVKKINQLLEIMKSKNKIEWTEEVFQQLTHC